MKRVALPGGYAALAFEAPVDLLDDSQVELRATIVAVSDAAFGTPSTALWREKFTPAFLSALKRFYLLVGARDEIVGWSGYRAATIAGERVVYFTSTGLLPSRQGMGLVPALQLRVVAAEARRHPLRPVTLVVRTRNPHSYRLAVRTFGGPVAPALDGTVDASRQALLAGIGEWLELDVDPATAVVRNAYDVEDGLYAHAPKAVDPAVNALFERLDARDALLVLGRRTRARALALAVTGSGRRTVAAHASAHGDATTR